MLHSEVYAGAVTFSHGPSDKLKSARQHLRLSRKMCFEVMSSGPPLLMALATLLAETRA